MAELKYKVITNKTQYRNYCNQLEHLVFSDKKTKTVKEEIALLTLLIEKWDSSHSTFKILDPIQLLHSFMADHDLKAKDLVDLLGLSKGYISEILNYKKGLSKDAIRKLAEYFKVSQEAFNRPYELYIAKKSPARNPVDISNRKSRAIA